jgi:predicted RNA-binding protein with RPS1 domain
MNTPEVPSQPSQDTAVVVPSTDVSSAVSDASSNGHTTAAEPNVAAAGHAATATDDPGDGHADSTEEPSAEAPGTPHEGEAVAEGGSAPPADGSAQAGQEKKRRRRRRRKKPGAHGATAEGQAGDAGEAPELEGGDSAPEGSVAVEGAVALEGAPSAAPERRPKKKERRPGPPRERPPVNAGDIVFGKILEITEDAILIDIPGKARAIFDRREMLLPDDDEPNRPSRAPPAPPAAADVAPSGASADAVEGVNPRSQRSPASSSKSAPTSSPSCTTTGRAAVSSSSRTTRTVPSGEAHRREGVQRRDGHRRARHRRHQGRHRGRRRRPPRVRARLARRHAPRRRPQLPARRASPFIVTQYAKRGRDLVLSRKAMLEDEAQRRAPRPSRLKIGEEVEGVVRSVVSFGAFIDVGGIEGLVPLQEMSHNRGDGPNDVFKAGETTKVKVLKIDERGKVWLSRKATIPTRGSRWLRSTRPARGTRARSRGCSRSAPSSSSSPASTA